MAGQVSRLRCLQPCRRGMANHGTWSLEPFDHWTRSWRASSGQAGHGILLRQGYAEPIVPSPYDNGNSNPSFRDASTCGRGIIPDRGCHGLAEPGAMTCDRKVIVV